MNKLSFMNEKTSDLGKHYHGIKDLMTRGTLQQLLAHYAKANTGIVNENEVDPALKNLTLTSSLNT